MITVVTQNNHIPGRCNSKQSHSRSLFPIEMKGNAINLFQYSIDIEIYCTQRRFQPLIMLFFAVDKECMSRHCYITCLYVFLNSLCSNIRCFKGCFNSATQMLFISPSMEFCIVSIKLNGPQGKAMPIVGHLL